MPANDIAPATRFPPTRPTILEAMADPRTAERRAAFDRMAAFYWKAACCYTRIRWRLPAEDAEDLVQGFFARSYEKGVFERFDASRARFRTYFRLCLDGHIQNERKAAARLKRGGSIEPQPLDDTLAAEGGSPDDVFRQEWIRTLFAAAIQSMRASMIASNQAIRFDVFRRYDIERAKGESVEYSALAAELGVSTHDITNHLAAARRAFRRAVVATLRTLCASEEEFRNEARELLGRDVL